MTTPNEYTGQAGNKAVEYVKMPAEYSQQAKHTFLFINESVNSKAGKKPGHRSDIRSHVRKYVIVDRRESVRENPSKKHGLVVQKKRIYPAGDAAVDLGGVARTWIEESFDVLNGGLPESTPRSGTLQRGSQELELHFHDEVFGSTDSPIQNR
ncbi:hypothetical protein VTL71DRAFT_13267 [Oculimacula yallundae]|uniref:Uncharacterized protein n=1 Tax=Oculimacula yallundae TaxID=86028 RepID=A0ABR4CJU7_9HELO